MYYEHLSSWINGKKYGKNERKSEQTILMNLNFSAYLNLEDAFILVVVLESGDTFQFRNFLYIWAQQSVKENGTCREKILV